MRVKKFTKFQPVMVYWRDIVSEPKWHDKEEVENVRTVEVHTLGFYINTKNRELRLAHSLDPKDEGCDVMCVPWSVITNIWEVEKKE